MQKTYKIYSFKNSSNGPTLSWVEIGISDLANVEIKKVLIMETRYLSCQAGLVDYQKDSRKELKIALVKV